MEIIHTCNNNWTMYIALLWVHYSEFESVLLKGVSEPGCTQDRPLVWAFLTASSWRYCNSNGLGQCAHRIEKWYIRTSGSKISVLAAFITSTVHSPILLP